MSPKKVFIPSQSTYQLALRFLKIVEADLHKIKQNKPAQFHQGNFEFDSEVAADCKALDLNERDTELLRLGFHLAAASISHQILEDLATNKKFFQSIGKLDNTRSNLQHILDGDQPKYNGLGTEEEFLVEVVEPIVGDAIAQLQPIKQDLERSYPYQMLLDLANSETVL